MAPRSSNADKKKIAKSPKSRAENGRSGNRKRSPAETRTQLVDAAFESLRVEGFRGTTARSIASRADCNQAAIYYHFGGIEDLLLQALLESSERRLERYRSDIDGSADLPALVAKLETLYGEDRESGHLAVMTELVGGITANPDLREGIEESTRAWLEFVEEQIRLAADRLPLGSLLPASDLADLIFSLVIGLELRNKIDGSTDRSDRLFRLAQLGAGLVGNAER